jgi:hypothetical protein
MIGAASHNRAADESHGVSLIGGSGPCAPITANEQATSQQRSTTTRSTMFVGGKTAGQKQYGVVGRPGLEPGTYGLKVHSRGGISWFDLEKGVPNSGA